MNPRIDVLDLDFRRTRRAIAAFLVRGGAGPVLVETGPASTIPNLVARLAEHGVEPVGVRHVLVTHIHLDHAGAAGWWARRGATIWVHPRGAPHLLDPAKLEASARRIYGDAMDEMWGPLTPAPAERVRVVEDGATIAVEGLQFAALDTPGHANHHHAYRLGDVAFTGDICGIRLPGTRWIDLPAPPPEFDLEQWKASLDRLRGEGLARIYRTHFGAADEVGEELDRLEELLDATAALIGDLRRRGAGRDEMLDAYRGWVRQRGVAAGAGEALLAGYEVANPRDMSVDGVARYWQKREDRQAS